MNSSTPTFKTNACIDEPPNHLALRPYGTRIPRPPRPPRPPRREPCEKPPFQGSGRGLALPRAQLRGSPWTTPRLTEVRLLASEWPPGRRRLIHHTHREPGGTLFSADRDQGVIFASPSAVLPGTSIHLKAAFTRI